MAVIRFINFAILPKLHCVSSLQPSKFPQLRPTRDWCGERTREPFFQLQSPMFDVLFRNLLILTIQCSNKAVARSAYLTIPKGLRHKAQGWSESARSYLGLWQIKNLFPLNPKLREAHNPYQEIFLSNGFYKACSMFSVRCFQYSSLWILLDSAHSPCYTFHCEPKENSPYEKMQPIRRATPEFPSGR